MHDDAYCLFLILASVLTLALPPAPQVLVAIFACVLAVAARPTDRGRSPEGPLLDDRHRVTGP